MAVQGDDDGAGLLRSSVRRGILDLLAALPVAAPVAEGVVPRLRAEGLTAAEVAESTGLHVTTARFHLDQLLTAGLVQAHFVRQGVGRPRKHYVLDETALPARAARANPSVAYEALAQLLAEGMTAGPGGAPASPEEAGRAWALRHAPDRVAADQPRAETPGQWLGKVGGLTDVLLDWGYQPAVATSEDGRSVSLEMRECPFLELARDQPHVVCAAHRGLIAGVLEVLGEPDAEAELRPFVEPRVCRAVVSTRAPFHSDHPSAAPSEGDQP